MRDSKNTLLAWKWTTSRGQDTAGWNICSLYADGVKMASTCGGGYDMKGTAFGDFIQDEYKERLLKLHRRAGRRLSVSKKDANGYRIYKRLKTAKAKNAPTWSKSGELYGLTAYYKRGEIKPYKMALDGGCGFESMQKIAQNIGITTKYHGNGSNTGHVSHILTDSNPPSLPGIKNW